MLFWRKGLESEVLGMMPCWAYFCQILEPTILYGLHFVICKWNDKFTFHLWNLRRGWNLVSLLSTPHSVNITSQMSSSKKQMLEWTWTTTSELKIPNLVKATKKVQRRRKSWGSIGKERGRLLKVWNSWSCWRTFMRRIRCLLRAPTKGLQFKLGWLRGSN